MDHRQALVEQFSHLRNFALTITRNPDTAEDLVQDTFVRALQRGGQLQCKDRLQPWLFRILRNLHTDYYRRAARRETQETPPDAALSVPARQEQQIYFGEVAQALDKLPAGDLLTASAMQYSYEEIAFDQQLPVGTVRSRISRTRAALLTQLEHLPVGKAANDLHGPARPAGSPETGSCKPRRNEPLDRAQQPPAHPAP